MDAVPAAVDEQIIKDMLWSFSFRTTEHAILLLDASGQIRWANAGAHRILAATSDSLVGHPLSRIFTLQDALAGIPEHEQQVARESGTASDDRWMSRLDSSRFWASGVTAYLGPDNECCAFLKVFRDLTEIKMQVENLKERCTSATQQSEQANVAIGILAHELRNPLSGISLSVDMVERHAAAGEDTGQPLDMIARNVTLASRLIEDLMQHSRLVSASVNLDRSRTTLRTLLESSTAIAQRQLQQEGRHVGVLVPSGDIEVFVDQMRMQQVFVNLIANALRYTAEPGRVWVTGSFEGKDIIVRISDQGMGIEPDRLERLFELFTLPHLKGSKLGLGLGLALVKKIVDLHGGTVQARSPGLNLGSQFIVRFPAAT